MRENRLCSRTKKDPFYTVVHITELNSFEES